MYEQSMTDAVRAELDRVGQWVRARGDAGAIPPESGRFLHALVLAGGYRRGIEIGTSYGFSSLWIGAALAHNGGVLTTIDIDPTKLAFAREVFARAGLSSSIDPMVGDAQSALAEAHGPFDFVFIDADVDRVQDYFDLLWPKLAHRATLVTDNVSSDAEALSTFVRGLRAHPELYSTLVAIGSGLEVSVKIEPRRTATLDGADWVI